MKNFYDILGVEKTAGQKEIKKAYRKLIRQFHPDLNKNQHTNASKVFGEITQAYSVLGNVEKRKSYDESLEQKKQVKSSAAVTKSHFHFRELRKWLFSSSFLRRMFGKRKVAQKSYSVDPKIVALSVDDLLRHVIMSNNPYVQVNAVRAIFAKKKGYAVNDLLRLLYSNISDMAKIEIIDGLKKNQTKNVKKVISEIYDIEKSFTVKQYIRKNIGI